MRHLRWFSCGPGFVARRLMGAVAVALAVMSLPLAAADCTREEFTRVADQAADTLKRLNAENTPAFQAKLRDLKAKRRWTHDQFMKQAEPLVRDERIAVYDEAINLIVAKITSLGESGEQAKPDCTLLGELRQQLDALVKTTEAKWAYMHGKVDAALAKAD